MATFIKDKIMLSGTDNESILSTVAKILNFGNVVRFNVDASSNAVDYWRLPSEEEMDDRINPFRTVLKQVRMEEYVSEEDETGERQLFSMCEILEDAGCFPVFLLIGCSIQQLRKWITFPRRSTQIVGIPILINPDLTDDIILVCGSKIKDAEPIDVTFIVKMTLP